METASILIERPNEQYERRVGVFVQLPHGDMGARVFPDGAVEVLQVESDDAGARYLVRVPPPTRPAGA